MQIFKRSFLIVFVSLFIAGCHEPAVFRVEKGVSKKLNDHRKASISNLSYEVFFSIPEQKPEPIDGRVILKFDLNDTSEPLVIDFQVTPSHVQGVSTPEGLVDHRFENGHILIPQKFLSEGPNEIRIIFTAGDQSLNRNDDYLYTLFVPDRASTAFPCFDQPNLKATYTLTLEVPVDWVAVANGRLEEKDIQEERSVYRFHKTERISTYLFAFVAGRFDAETRERNGRSLTIYHRETDPEKIQRNMNALFNQHFDALDWMEIYTDIPLPFAKFDFVAIPSFQYGGMEHPGCILYRAEKMFLDPTATQEDMLDRATLIAHETAHMWFGDLVTMAWFDDVWLKEVFANFMAAKMVNPAFPDINHDQAFLIDHYPRAYAIDRTAGANAIKQELENMNLAGTLYGNIIYHKAPIVMLQVEGILGKEKLREGLKQYLEQFAYSNADWDDLVEILDNFTNTDLQSWSEVWVKEAGMPFYELMEEGNKRYLVQSDPGNRNRIWPQKLHLMAISGEGQQTEEIVAGSAKTEVLFKPEEGLFLPNGNGMGYGYFRFSETDIDFITAERLFGLSPLTRAVIYISLWENLLNGSLDPLQMGTIFEHSLERETDELNVNLLLKYYSNYFWQYCDDNQRNFLAGQIEPLLWKKTETVTNQSLRSAYFKAFQKTAITEKAVVDLYKLWKGELEIKGLALSGDDLVTLAFELAVRQSLVSDYEADHILEFQLENITNPDKRKRMQFITPALNNNEPVRDAFYESLKDPVNREQEPWVLTALHYLHHPLRAESAVKYIMPSLDMLEEIQVTGDIFFPMGWLEATLGGHRSNLAADHVQIYLNNHPDLDPKLRQKVLQAADPLFRAVSLSK